MTTEEEIQKSFKKLGQEQVYKLKEIYERHNLKNTALRDSILQNMYVIDEGSCVLKSDRELIDGSDYPDLF